MWGWGGNKHPDCQPKPCPPLHDVFNSSPPCNHDFPRIETQENDGARGGPVYETGEHGFLIGAEKV